MAGSPSQAMIHRDPRQAAGRDYDLIVVGGGIYGVALAFEAARRGLAPLLLERDDFGEATSAASLRIVHGGFRYLQSFDLTRFRESVSERRWWLRHFPDLVRPLACLMPLHGDGIYRRDVFRVALAVDDALSCRRNVGVTPDRRLAAGRILGPVAATALYPAIDRDRLTGAALWHDAVMISSERLLIEMLRWAIACGARALNYVEAMAPIVAGGGIAGIEALDHVTGERLSFRANRIANAAGPWCRDVAGRLDRDVPVLFPPSLALNLLLDRPPIASTAVALRSGGRNVFIVPWRGRMLAGTYHAAWRRDGYDGDPGAEPVEAFLGELNAAAPELALRLDDVVRTYAGLMPAAPGRADVPASRPIVHDHGHTGGPRGLYSVSGVKYTTARLVAERTVRRMFGDRAFGHALARPAPSIDLSGMGAADRYSVLDGAEDDVATLLRRITETEAVVDPGDLVARRLHGLLGDLDDTAAARAVDRILAGADAAPEPVAP